MTETPTPEEQPKPPAEEQLPEEGDTTAVEPEDVPEDEFLSNEDADADETADNAENYEDQ